MGEKCVKECENGLESCFIACGGDIDCMMSCNRDYAKCSDSCPCHTDCIDGCKNCDNPVCFCNGVVDENYDSCVSKNSLSLGKFHKRSVFFDLARGPDFRLPTESLTFVKLRRRMHY